MGCSSASGEAMIGETMTEGGGETDLSSSSSTGRTDRLKEDARGVLSSRISSSAFSLSGGSFDRPSEQNQNHSPSHGPRAMLTN